MGTPHTGAAAADPRRIRSHRHGAPVARRGIGAGT